MGKFIDLTGKKFNKLTVIKKIDYDFKQKEYIWECVCECGNKTKVAGVSLRTGNTKSCGCLVLNRIKNLNKKHGYTGTKLYICWKNMRQRCKNKKLKQYKDYGGRGIKVCEEWNNFINFKNWALENGHTDSLTIDRIDVNGNYEPSNCRWVSMKEQCNNKRNNRFITFNNKTLTLSQWSEKTGINYQTLQGRIHEHKNIELFA